MYSKEELKKESETLDSCPFCGGYAEFVTNKSEQIMIQHHPESGINCPARYEQYCDSFDQGRNWWNNRIDSDMEDDGHLGPPGFLKNKGNK